jgi:hypothetical protein
MIGTHDRIKALLVFGEGFEGYDLAAVWDDARLGLRHWRGFERIAVVSDVGWLRTAVRAIGVAMPCPVRLIGQLEPRAYDGVEAEIAQLFASSQPVRLLVDLREFDGWSGLAALGDHLSRVRGGAGRSGLGETGVTAALPLHRGGDTLLRRRPCRAGGALGPRRLRPVDSSGAGSRRHNAPAGVG